jgi:gliding motility-associated-like protein
MQQYTWSPVAGLSNSSGTAVTIYAVQSTTYQVSGTDANGCIDTTYFNLTAHPYAEAIFSGDSVSGCSPLTVNFSNSSTNADAYQWNFGNGYSSNEATPSATYTTGDYTVSLIAYSPYGCNDTLTLYNYIHAYPVPTADFTSTPEPGTVLEVKDATITFVNLSQGATAYEWYFGDGGMDSVKNPVYKYETDSLFEVMLIAISGQGCADTAYRYEQIVPDGVVFIPNTFTPNGDGKNDVFRVYGKSIKNIDMRIYDRWGDMVYFSSEQDPYWDGSMHDKMMNTAVFVYMIRIDFLNGASWYRKGDITLLR